MGESSVTEHIAVGNDDARRIADAATQIGVPAIHVPDSTAARAALAEYLRVEDVALVKGSNSVG